MALISEINKWHWLITWDNPVPADSSKMLKGLGKLGKLVRLQTKTTVILAPKKSVTYGKIRKVISSRLHPVKGNAVYINLKTKNAFQYGSTTGHVWKKVN